MSARPVALDEREWRELVGVLGWNTLSWYTGKSVTSLRRYAADHPAPDEVAVRLRWLVGVVADLRAGYNDVGIRRWFDRPRSSLAGRAPAEFLLGEWSPDDPAIAEVRVLAARLTGPR